MAIRTSKGQYKCPFCNFSSVSIIEVNDHRDKNHVYVLIAMEVDDLNRLVQFCYTKDEALLSEGIVQRLRSYLHPSKQITKITDNNVQES